MLLYATSNFRSIGCFLILIFHVNWYMHYTVHNASMMFVYGEQMLWQWVGTTPIIVDAFFTIRLVCALFYSLLLVVVLKILVVYIGCYFYFSGLLLSYNFLRNEAKLNEIRANTFVENIKLFGKQLLHRYIRYVSTVADGIPKI